jgi:hypothetical protein
MAPRIEDGGQQHFIFPPFFKSQIANRKSTGGFKRLQRIGNDAAANHNLIGCAHKILDWPHKGAKARKRIILRDFASAV